MQRQGGAQCVPARIGLPFPPRRHQYYAGGSEVTDMEGMARDYVRIENAIRYLDDNFRRQPSLKDIAEKSGLSESHFQRLFARWVGISPKRFIQFLTKEYAKKLLQDSRSVLDAAFDAGLSGPGRLHDLFVSCEAVTPGEYKTRGEGMTICYGIHPSPFGPCMIAATERGMCGLRFLQAGDEKAPLERLRSAWPNAAVVQNPRRTAPLAARAFSFPRPLRKPLHLFVQGTNFQIKVWEALLQIPSGSAVSYEQVARFIGHPKGTRAVGTAIGANPIPFLIPCHRVIRKTGDFGNYSEGAERKKAILGWEAALRERSSM
jgi:AraC family transcriptional regulator of adaptative response/methylated-DNA-[protein]-cysteine methyltransferase